MSLEKSMEITKEDVNRLKMLKVLIKSANFDVKGEALPQCGAILNWFEGFDTKVEMMLAKKGAPKIEEVN